MLRAFPWFCVLLMAPLAEATLVQFAGNEHTYEVVSPAGGITWTDAKAAAAARSFQGQNGHLATLTSAAEEQFAKTSFGSNYIWIGLTDEATEGQFKWITGETFSYSDWLANEPNNSATDPPGEDYVMLDPRIAAGGWNDYQNISNILAGPPISYMVEYETPEPSSLVLGIIPACWLLRRRARRAAV